jgi:hypothetical protein
VNLNYVNLQQHILLCRTSKVTYVTSDDPVSVQNMAEKWMLDCLAGSIPLQKQNVPSYDDFFRRNAE